MAVTDSLVFLPTLTDAARPSSFPSFSPERKSKPLSPKKSPVSPAPKPRQSSSHRPIACRRPVPISPAAADATTSTPPTSSNSKSRKKFCARTAKLELQREIQVHPSPPWNYRNRSRFQLRARPDFAAGYFKFSSHELLPVEECPISSPLINRALAALWQAGRAGKAVEGVREIEFFANSDDSQILVEFLCAPEARRAAVRAWAEELCASMPEIVGVAAFREPQKGVQEPLVAVGASELTNQTKTAAYRVSAGAFFQSNRFLIDELVNVVTSARSGELALDLYAGVGLFSTALAGSIRHVVSVESSQTAVGDLKYNLPLNAEVFHTTTDQYLAQCGDNSRAGNGAVLPQLLHRPDLVVVDPPRGGLGDRVARLLTGVGAPRVTYVSCDPATLSRDLLPLQAAGYRVEEVHLVDLFPQTYHLETVLHLVR